jgi:hypothetical protein
MKLAIGLVQKFVPNSMAWALRKLTTRLLSDYVSVLGVVACFGCICVALRLILRNLE